MQTAKTRSVPAKTITITITVSHRRPVSRSVQRSTAEH